MYKDYIESICIVLKNVFFKVLIITLNVFLKSFLFVTKLKE